MLLVFMVLLLFVVDTVAVQVVTAAVVYNVAVAVVAVKWLQTTMIPLRYGGHCWCPLLVSMVDGYVCPVLVSMLCHLTDNLHNLTIC